MNLEKRVRSLESTITDNEEKPFRFLACIGTEDGERLKSPDVPGDEKTEIRRRCGIGPLTKILIDVDEAAL